MRVEPDAYEGDTQASIKLTLVLAVLLAALLAVLSTRGQLDSRQCGPK
jgi:hypothetical protein